MKKTWEDAVVELNDGQIDKGIDDFIEKFTRKIKQKGKKSFFCTQHVAGKILEEFNEVMVEVHQRDQEKFEEELLDVAITAVFGYISSKAWPKKDK